MVVEVDDPAVGRMRTIGIPVKLSATPGSIRHRAPGLGEHSREILAEAGFSDQEVQRLVDKGVVLTL